MWIYLMAYSKENAKIRSETSDCDNEYFSQEKKFILLVFSFQWT